MSDFVQHWLNTAGRFPLLPKSEIIRLAKKRDQLVPNSPEYVKIVNKICEHNLRLVPNVVRKYLSKRTGVNMSSEVVSDLLQQGYIGLRRAAEKYDGARGFTFSTYAYNWIFQSVSRWHNSNDRAIYIPESTINEVLYRRRHGLPSNTKNGRIRPETLDAAEHCLSIKGLDQRISDDDEGTLLEMMGEENRIIDKENTADQEDASILALKEILSACAIPPLAQDVVLLYTKRPHMAMVGAKVKKHPKTCRQMYDNAIEAMKSYAGSQAVTGTVRMKHNQPL